MELEEKSFRLALLVIEAFEFLKKKDEVEISHKFLDSGSLIGLNIHLANSVQQPGKYLSTAFEKAVETKYWIQLLEVSGFLRGFEKLKQIKTECDSIIASISHF